MHSLDPEALVPERLSNVLLSVHKSNKRPVVLDVALFDSNPVPTTGHCSNVICLAEENRLHDSIYHLMALIALASSEISIPALSISTARFIVKVVAPAPVVIEVLISSSGLT